MTDIKLEEQYSYLAVGCTHRVYLLFASDYVPLWTPLLRFILRLRQGTPVTHSHVLVAVQHVEDKVLNLFEMTFNETMQEYYVEYEGAYYTNSKLSIDQLQYNGVTQTETWDAIDVTRYIVNPELIDERFYDAYTAVPLTPRTLLTHLTRAKDKLTWTCTGLAMVLLGFDKRQSFQNPLTPDQLRATVTLMLQSY